MSNREKYLITGASGFIGSMLLRKLLKKPGKNIHLILRKKSNLWRINDLLPSVEIHYSDLSKISELIDIVQKVKPDIIYHLATNGAYSYQENASEIINTNILGTWNLLQACNEVDYKLFVNTGSSSEYGYKDFAMREIDILEPASYYAVTKSAQTLLCSHIARQENRPIVTLRPFSVYGPYEEPGRLIPTLMKSLNTKRQMNLVSPEIARDYIYIDDMVEAFLKTEELKKNSGDYFNIGTGIQTTIKSVTDKAKKAIKKPLLCSWGDMESRKWDTTTWVADISKAKRLLNWHPKHTLEDGLLLTWQWYQKNTKYYE